MTAEDFGRLALYRNKRGPLNPMLRMDAGFALLASSIFNAAGVKRRDGQPFQQSDFMQWARDEEPEASIESVFGLLQSKAAESKDKKR